MSKIVPATEERICEAASLIRSGNLVAFPTETVYGLGANAFDEQAVRKIYVAKGRPSNNPLIVHIPTIDQVDSVADLSDPSLAKRLQKLSHLWPGPLSVVLPKGPKVAPSACANLPSVAVRIPNHPVALRLLTLCECPIAAPSANPANYISPTTAAHVADQLSEQVSLILDGGACKVGLESTIVSLIGPYPQLLRPGWVSFETLREFLPDLRNYSAPHDSAAPIAPGMLKEHYAPQTRLIMRTEFEPHAHLNQNIGLISFSALKENEHPFAKSVVLSQNNNLEEVAESLFAALRELDKNGLDLIVVDTCPAQGLGAAIMDKILRATARNRN